MKDITVLSPVSDEESLARFIVNSNEVRADGTARPQLFLPYKHVTLSVNRHLDSSDAEIWTVGMQVAHQRQKTLLGRADIQARDCRIETLDVVASPIIPSNPSHAEVVGFPARKDEQLSIALKLAASIQGRCQKAPGIANG